MPERKEAIKYCGAAGWQCSVFVFSCVAVEPADRSEEKEQWARQRRIKKFVWSKI